MIYRDRVNTTTSVNTLPYVWELDVPIASGNISLFWQAVAPTGWTKQTTHNNKTLRVVSGSASSGGGVTFTTVFSAQTPAVSGLTADNTTITTSTMSIHTHFGGGTSAQWINPMNSRGGPAGFVGTTGVGPQEVSTKAGNGAANTTGSASTVVSGSAGSSGAHTHGVTVNGAVPLAVKYVDIIFALKN